MNLFQLLLATAATAATIAAATAFAADVAVTSGLLLRCGRQPVAFNRANFGTLQPGTAIDGPNQAQPGVAGNWAMGGL